MRYVHLLKNSFFIFYEFYYNIIYYYDIIQIRLTQIRFSYVKFVEWISFKIFKISETNFPKRNILQYYETWKLLKLYYYLEIVKNVCLLRKAAKLQIS